MCPLNTVTSDKDIVDDLGKHINLSDAHLGSVILIVLNVLERSFLLYE